MINRRLLIYGAAKDIPATALTIGVGINELSYGYSDGTMGGTFGAITPNPLTISGHQGTVKTLFITGVAGLYLRMCMFIMWKGNNYPTNLIVSFATTAGKPVPDVTQSYDAFSDGMACYSFDGDQGLTKQLYAFFKANVGNTVPCEISDAMPQP